MNQLISALIILLVSYTGTLFGLALSLLAPEELKPGEKYFLLIRNILLVILFFVSNYLLFFSQKYWALVIFTTIAVIIFVQRIKTTKIFSEIITYLLSTLVYLYIAQETLAIVIPIIIFLYGLPTGSLLRKRIYHV